VVSIQILALTLIPVLSAVVPGESGMGFLSEALPGFHQKISAEFLVGTWKWSEDFFRWGISDRNKAKVTPHRGRALMSLDGDGTLKMVNFLRPKQGRWELTDKGIVIHDPGYPERGSQILPVRKRDNDRIWVLLPFAGGSVGIGMMRVPAEEFSKAQTAVETEPVPTWKGSRRDRRPTMDPMDRRPRERDTMPQEPSWIRFDD